MSDTSSSYAGSATSIARSEQDHDLSHFLATSFLDPALTNSLDRIIALQSQTSGLLNAQSTSLSLLLQESSLALDALKGELGDGAKLAREVGRELGDLTKRIDVCRREAERRYPVEYHAAKEHVLTSETRDDED